MSEEKHVYGSLDEELNVQSKRILHEWLEKAISDHDKYSFRHCIAVLGTSWNVKRTVETAAFEGFVSHLWDNADRIKSGAYVWQREALLYVSGGRNKHAYSYESKVCFAIAPAKYKIIYDKNTRTHLKEQLGRAENITLAAFSAAVDEWCANAGIADEENEDTFYRADYALWSGKGLERYNNGGNE